MRSAGLEATRFLLSSNDLAACLSLGGARLEIEQVAYEVAGCFLRGGVFADETFPSAPGFCWAKSFFSLQQAILFFLPERHTEKA